MKYLRKYWMIIVIVIIASILRLWQLGTIPTSLNWDEVAFGYNAYSLGIDGRDEFGVLSPFSYLESFGDFKPPLYAYLTIIPVWIFGLSELAVRLPSAILGIGSVFITYFLVQRIFYSSPQKKHYALSAAFLLAISPWHVNLSRAAFEANVATFLILCGVWLFLLGIQKSSWYFLASMGSFALSFYTFNTPRIVVPLLGLVLVVAFFKELKKHLLQVSFAVILGIVVVGPLVPFLLSPQAKLRFQEVNIFSNVKLIDTSNKEIANDHHSLWSKVLHNRRLSYAREYLDHYLDNFNPLFLFVHGDVNRRFSTQDVGQMYFWELPFFVVGILYLFRKREGYWWLIPLWLLLGIIPAATARETPHALRIESSLPMFQVLTGYGLINLARLFRKNVPSFAEGGVVGLVSACVVISFLIYTHGYFTHYAVESSSDWQYGYKEAMLFVNNNQQKYKKVVITEKMGRPYIYSLFYMHVPPSIFRNDSLLSRDNFGFVHVKRFGKYYFTDDVKSFPVENTLFISLPVDVPENSTVLKRFLLPDGKEQLVAYIK